MAPTRQEQMILMLWRYRNSVAYDIRPSNKTSSHALLTLIGVVNIRSFR